ncbi:helix-turn-helix domain-containing protein [Nonomuraea sediminis]|uniref:helix-turn-helix domain-containing protein n=1 Tax=Nonomuraea sediminis TaxID=2835864 RepID=UPI001BDD4920|nr:MarR family transcriptional regulator [Nonomuraea sediminis]
MDAAQLHRLGRRLIELSAEVTGEVGDVALGAAEMVILEDAMKYPDSPIRDIQHRTGFAQSHVSAVIARLRSLGALETVADPGDGRRTLVRVAPGALRAMQGRGARDAVPALAAALHDEAAARRVTALLDELAGILL